MGFQKIQKEIFNPIYENVKKLAELFPSAVKDGQVDFEALKAELGQFETVSEKLSERYELGWAGKEDAKRLASTDIVGRTLKYIPEDSKNPDTTENLYIEGDNLEVLKLLRNCYYNRIKMIYIDPPYNTGNDFIYRDDFKVSEEENAVSEGEIDQYGERLIVNQKSSGKYHSNWLSMMYPRLKVAKDLLTEDGIIFVSIGDDEVSNLKKLCDEVFGEPNCIAIVTRLMKTGGNKGRFFSPNVDYVLVYAKNIFAAENFKGELDQNLTDKLYNKIETEGERKGERYRPFGLYQSSLDARPNQRYYIQCPDGTFAIPPGTTMPEKIADGYKVIPDQTDGCWRWSSDRYLEEKAKGNIVFTESPNGVLITPDGTPSKWNVYTKIWLSDRQDEGQTPTNFISKFENRHSAKELKELDIAFDFAKPSDLIKYLISLVDDTKEAIICDFFSGSATTAHAVMQLNAEDGGNRKFIMVQLPEPCDEKSEAYKAGYRNICEIGKERIRRAGEKIKEENKDKEGIENLDIGFKVFRVADTNIRWFSEAMKSDIMTPVEELINDKDRLDFNPGFTDIDVVYEVLLRHRDIPLSAKVEKLTSIGERTYIFADTVVVCLEQNVTESMIDKIAAIEPMPMKIIFRDSAFGDDITLKTNSMLRLEAQMKKNSGIQKKAYRVEFI